MSSVPRRRGRRGRGGRRGIQRSSRRDCEYVSMFGILLLCRHNFRAPVSLVIYQEHRVSSICQISRKLCLPQPRCSESFGFCSAFEEGGRDHRNCRRGSIWCFPGAINSRPTAQLIHNSCGGLEQGIYHIIFPITPGAENSL